jgi:peptide/nickel transport system substrate-binding protein
MQIGMLPEHALRGTNAAQLASHPFNLTPIGTGAYQLEQIITDANGQMNAVLLRAAPTYRLRPEGQTINPIERIEFRLFADFGTAAAALQAIEIDGLAGRTRGERQRLLDTTTISAAVNLYTQIEPTLGVLIYNWERENLRLFRDQRVRVALQQGLNRASIIDRNLSSLAVPANSPLIPGSWAYLANLPWAAFDPVAAQQLISEALGGIATPTLSPDQTVEPPQPVSFTILVPDDPLLATIVQEIATQWSQLGLEVIFISEDEPTYRQRLESGDFDAALIEYSLGSTADPDVYTFWHESQLPPDGLNYGGAVDRRISELIERARREASGINRIQLYQEFQRVFAQRAIAIPLYYPLFSYAVSSQISGVQLGVMGNLSDRFRNITEWQFIPSS